MFPVALVLNRHENNLMLFDSTGIRKSVIKLTVLHLERAGFVREPWHLI